MRGSDAGNRVGGAWTGGNQHHAGLAGSAGVAVRHVGSALLVTHQNVLNLLLPVDFVVDVQYRAFL